GYHRRRALRSATAGASRWSFPRQSFVLASVLALASDFPILAGRVPLPTDALRYFPVWESVASLRAPVSQHAELGDLVTLMYPFRNFLAESLRAGRLPYWNSRTFLGAPFLANPISAAFYPPNWLFAALPTRWAWSLQFPLRVGLAAFLPPLSLPPPGPLPPPP